MGLRGYPGMMGPKGEAVRKDPCTFLFVCFFFFFFCDVLNPFGHPAVLILLSTKETLPRLPALYKYHPLPAMGTYGNNATTNLSSFSNELGLSGPGCLHLYLMTHRRDQSYC